MARTSSQRKGSQFKSSINENAAASAAAIAAAGNISDHQSISRKSKFRYLTARGEAFEKQLAELLQSLSGYARRSAKLRDSGDMIAEALNAISVGEVLNPSLKETTSDLAKSIRSIQDHRDSEVLYFEDKLLPQLSAFGASLQKQREEIRSSTNKVFDGRSKWSTAAASSASRSSSTRRSQSAERVEKPSKEERALQQTAQRYELKRNLLLRKVLLKLILSELRYTIRAFNSLTDVYKTVSRGFSPLDDLKLFNDFFHFRSLNRAALTEVEGDVSDVESAEEKEDTDSEEDEEAEDSDNEEEEEEEEEEESEESGLEEDDTTEGDLTSEIVDSRRSGLGKDDGGDDQLSESSINSSTRSEQLAAIQSTLRRFNSTPEIPISGSAAAATAAAGSSKATSKNNNKWNG